MKTVTFRIVGTSPLMTHNPKSMKVRTEGPKPKEKIPTPEEEAEAGSYRMENGQLYLRTAAPLGALTDGGQGFRIGMGKSARSARKVLGETVFAIEECCPLFDPETGEPVTKYEIDLRRVVVQGQGVLRARPRIDRWACDFTVEYDDDFMSPEIIEGALERAGRIVGVGEMRPRAPKGRSGPFGRFTVERVNP